MYKAELNRTYIIWFYVFLGSFLAGVFIMNVGNDVLLSKDGIFSLSTINRLKYIEIDGGNFFPFVFKNRIKEFFLLVLLSTTGIGLIAVYVNIVWRGVLTGMFITAAAIRFGMKGLLLLMAGVLPHQLLLVPAGVMLLGWCNETCCQIYFPAKTKGVLPKNKKRLYIRQSLILLWIFAALLIGCILESYVNPILLSEIIKIF